MITGFIAIHCEKLIKLELDIFSIEASKVNINERKYTYILGFKKEIAFLTSSKNLLIKLFMLLNSIELLKKRESRSLLSILLNNNPNSFGKYKKKANSEQVCKYVITLLFILK
ncbi:hypothetical protein [Clostridium paraputrificum]|uniref:hypothetical protein n=1 Tax=Clostridium paraputrificum TaxID=29363 RepID=UPI00232B42F5|nr:hypothetical protein [Clostridium paraputrificum]MDB2106027.1 hypothetical protein [Clostridium paraputrificum]MDB2114251.1 hypothetical protein [Clostridium paraputrificum]